MSHVANGQIKTDAKSPLPMRLAHLDTALAAVIAEHRPDTAAVEEVYLNDNPQSTLKLAHARGVILLACARGGLAVTEYAPRLVKKAVVGTGAAAKEQVQAMLRTLLPGVKPAGPDAADALAVAITHAHHGVHRGAHPNTSRSTSYDASRAVFPLPGAAGKRGQ